MSAPGPGMQLGRYELISPLGSGGMGLVWRARDVRLSRTVAIKFARERFSDRVEREARCIGALNHPNICTLYDVCEDYLVMELIDGKPLTGPLPIEEVLKYAIQIADALTAAHRQGIVHRDLKPTNILLTKAGVKLLDFGVAEQRNDRADLEATALDSTPTGAVIGTPLYMAPEQLAGKIADTRADIFAFGAVLHELITGKPAFEFRSSAATIARFPTEHPQSASDAEVLASSALNNVVQTCLEKDPDDRWQSASELKHALTWIHTAHSRPRRNPPATRIRILYLLLLIPAFLGGFGIAFWLKPGYLEPPKIETVTYSGRDFAPAVSPDGRIVAFSSDRDGTPRIWLKQLDGGGEVALTSGSDDNPRFSPDGTSLLFSRNVGGRLSLYRVSSLGGDARKIIDDAVNGDFSPDGRHIGFIRWKIQMQDQRSVIGTAASDGSNAVEIASFPNTRLDRPRWSPDGSKIATVGSTAVQGGIYLETWVIGADGSGPRQLKAFGLNRGISSLDWADNRTLIYTRGDRGMPVDGQLIFHDIRKDLVTGTPWPCCALTVDASRGRVIFDEQATRSGLLKVGLEDDSEAWISRANSCDRQPAFRRMETRSCLPRTAEVI